MKMEIEREKESGGEERETDLWPMKKGKDADVHTIP